MKDQQNNQNASAETTRTTTISIKVPATLIEALDRLREIRNNDDDLYQYHPNGLRIFAKRREIDGHISDTIAQIEAMVRAQMLQRVYLEE